MSFKPKTGNKSNAVKRDPSLKYPSPKAGNRPARVSLIVDLGNQNRPDYEDPQTGEVRPQKPADQIAIFLDLTSDVVDYGGELGMKPYRLMLNKSFNGDITGINFGIGPIRDAQGTVMKDKPWNYHPMSVITKLAKATKTQAILDGKNLDLEQLLNKPLMATVEVKQTEDKNGKIDESTGKVRVYENVNFRGVSEVPEMPDGSLFPVPECDLAPRAITFDNATAADVAIIRRDVIAKIKQANNYRGSQMEKAIAEFEGTVVEDAPASNTSMPAQADYDAFDGDIPFAPIGLQEGKLFLHMI